MNNHSPRHEGTTAAPRVVSLWVALISILLLTLTLTTVGANGTPNGADITSDSDEAPLVEATPDLVATSADTARLLVDGQDYTATTPAKDVSSGSGYNEQLTLSDGTSLRRYVSFDTLVGNWQNELVITKIVVKSSASGTNYPFVPKWGITKDGATSGSNYRECTANCTGASAREFTINIADNAAPNGATDLATWARNSVKVWFNGGNVTNLNQYSFEVYGYYTNTDPFETASPTPSPTTSAAPTTPAAPTTTATAPAPTTTATAPAPTTTATAPTTTAPPATTTSTTTTTVPAPYSGNWNSDPGPNVSPTHEISQVRESTYIYRVTDKFSLGCSTGSSIRRIKYTYIDNDPNVSISAQPERWGVKIGSILDTATYSGTPRPISVNYLIIGYEYDLAGNVTVRIYRERDSISDSINFEFIDTNTRQPVYMDIPGNTPVTLNYQRTGYTNLDPKQAKIEVDGTCNGKVDVTTPGDPDPIVNSGDVCTVSGGSVWVAASKDAPSSYSGRLTTTLYEQTYGSQTFNEIATSNWVYNAVAYNPKDGYLYAISQGRIKSTASNSGNPTYDEDPNYPAGHLLRISPINGSVQDLGFVSGIQSQPVGTWPNDLWGGINAGTIDANGIYSFSNSSSSGTRDVYTLNLSQVPANAPFPRWTVTRNTASSISSNDYTYAGDGTSPYVYGIVNGSNTIERVDTRTGARSTFSMNGITDPLGNTMPAGTYGTSWTYGNGNLGFGRNNTNLSYQIKIIDNPDGSFRAELVSVAPAPSSWNNDATSNALVLGDTDMKIEKKLPGIVDGVATWSISVTNLGPCGSSGFTVTDYVPNYYQDIKVSFDDSGWVQNSLTPATNTSQNVLQALHGPLHSGETVTLTLTANVTDPSSGVCVENTASVYGNESDNNQDNNSASDGACSLSITKDVVDQNGDEMVDGADTNLAGINGSRMIQYRVVVNNPADAGTNRYTLTDTPQFASLVNVLGARVESADVDSFTADHSGPGPWTLATDVAINPGETDTYLISVFYTAPTADPSTDPTAECVIGSAGNGLFNSATATWDGGSTTDSGCGPIVRDSSVTLYVQKIDADGVTGPLSGAAFAIYGAHADGGLGELVKEMSSPEAGYFTAVLEPETTYYLVETKAPQGYSLLPTPIEFRITRDASGIALVDFVSGGALATNTADLAVTNSPTTAYINIADVRQGDLPETGGNGVGWLIGLGSLIMFAGAAISRRYAH